MDAKTTEAVELLRRLIATPSTSRDESRTADLIFAYLAEHGAAPERLHNNVFARSAGFDPARPTLLLNSHHDTVRPAASYTRDPYAPTVEGDRLYGLGSNDAGASAVSLTQTFLTQRTRPLPFNLLLALSAEEECMGEHGMRTLLPQLGRIDMAIVGEPTGMQAAVGERGLVVLDCEARGKSGHAARNEGINALYIALDDIARLRSFRFDRVSELLGPIGIAVTQITAGTQLGFEQQGLAFGLQRLEGHADVADGIQPGSGHFQQPVGHLLGGLGEFEVRIESLHLRQFPVQHELDALDQHVRLFQPAHQDRLFHDPITVSRGNALTGGAIGAITQTDFFQGVFQGVDRQAEGGAVGDGELRSHAGGLHFSQFLGQRLRADDHARAEHDQAIRVEDAAWQLVQLEGAKIVDHGVAGVVAALETDAGGGLACQIIDDAAFAFITPVSTYDYDRRHDSFS